MSVSRKIGVGFFLIGFLAIGWALTGEGSFKSEISYKYISEVEQEPNKPVLSIENLDSRHDPEALEKAIETESQYVKGYIPDSDYGIVPSYPTLISCMAASSPKRIYVEKDSAVHLIQVRRPVNCHAPHSGRTRYNRSGLAGILAFILGITSIGIGKTIKKLKDRKNPSQEYTESGIPN